MLVHDTCKTYPHRAFSRAAEHINFVTISTGIISMTALPSALELRIMPLATPTERAIGPPQLSPQPGKGSLNEVNTVNKTARSTEKITDLQIHRAETVSVMRSYTEKKKTLTFTIT